MRKRAQRQSLEGAALPSQKVIPVLFPSRFEEDVEKHRDHCEE